MIVCRASLTRRMVVDNGLPALKRDLSGRVDDLLSVDAFRNELVIHDERASLKAIATRLKKVRVLRKYFFLER